MKICSRCKVEKEGTEFSRHTGRPDGLQIWCKPCKAVFDRAHFQKNKAAYALHNKRTRDRNSRLLYDYLLTRKCSWEDCEISDPDMLTFDHKNPANKFKDVSTLVRGSYSWKTIQAEIAKCRILCANHHHKYTIQQFGYKRWLTESVSQT